MRNFLLVLSLFASLCAFSGENTGVNGINSRSGIGGGTGTHSRITGDGGSFLRDEGTGILSIRTRHILGDIDYIKLKTGKTLHLEGDEEDLVE